MLKERHRDEGSLIQAYPTKYAYRIKTLVAIGKGGGITRNVD